MRLIDLSKFTTNGIIGSLQEKQERNQENDDVEFYVVILFSLWVYDYYTYIYVFLL